MAQEMTRRIVNGLNFDGGRTRVGVVTYSDSAKARFHLNSYTDKTSVLNAISYTLENGRTNTASGIDMARYNMFSSNKGDRAGDQNYAVIITDGNSNINRGGTIPAANGARRAGIKMIAIGIGENRKVDRSEINGIANDPDNQFA
ncbi:VWA domain-containing protein, partial [Bacillus thuringiensis]|nr:VWA domain-containing protein [Bacillus thuringiensis]